MPGSDPQADTSIHFVDPSSMVVVPQEAGAARVSVQSSPTDKYGVAVARISYDSATSISGTTTHHMIGIGCSKPVRTEHMIEGKRLHHHSGPGCLCICPAGARHFTAFDGPMEGVVLQVSPECLMLAMADLAAHTGTLVERMDGQDPVLTRIARVLEAEAAANHPNGMLFWSSVTDVLLEHLAAHHLSTAPASPQGRMHASALKRLEDFIQSNLAEPLDLDSLAAVVGCPLPLRSPFPSNRGRKSTSLCRSPASSTRSSAAACRRGLAGAGRCCDRLQRPKSLEQLDKASLRHNADATGCRALTLRKNLHDRCLRSD
jgi:AraC family transcriptional regulator